MKPLELPTLQSLSRHPFVWSMVIISCFSYYLLLDQGLQALSPWFMPQDLAALLENGSIWRLWSPIFVHYTLLHLLTNIYLWWLFASKIESESILELLIVSVISAACSNLAQWWVAGSNFGGLSGVTYALMAYLWVSERYAGKSHFHIEPQLVIILLLIIPIAATGRFGNFADTAHIIGLLSGALLAIASIAFHKTATKWNM